MRQIRHTGIYVNDIELMKDFYCSVFNMHVETHDVEQGPYIETVLGIDGVKVEIYKLSTTDGGMIELLKPIDMCYDCIPGKKLVDKGVMHIAFTVNELESLFGLLTEKNIFFISPPHLSKNGNVKVCFCQDPEGNYLELVEELESNNELS